MAPKIKIFLLVFSLISVGCSSEVDDFNNQSTKVNSSQLTDKLVSQDDKDLKETLQRKANNQELSENLENDLVFTEKESTHTGIESTARNTTSEESSTLSADATKEVISEEKGRITIDGADVSETDSVHDAYVEGGDAHRDDESKPLEVTFTDEDVNDKPLEGQLGSFDVAQRGIEKFEGRMQEEVATNSLNMDYIYGLAFLLISLALVISISISFYLYKWRKVLLLNKNMAVPEDWVKHLVEFNEGISGFTSSINKRMSFLEQHLVNQSTQIKNMVDTYMELHEELDKKDLLIKRYSDGYDAEIFKKFVIRFARVHQAIEDFINDNQNDETLSQLKRLMEDALEESNVIQFSPNIGEDYRTALGVADNPRFISTEIAEDDFTISEVLEAGYMSPSGEHPVIIIPSKVVVYKHKE